MVPVALRSLPRLFILPLLAALAACGSPGSTALAVAGGVVGATILTGSSPAHEIEQVYYLGIFDPQEQVPPSVYRVIVRGQASFTSSMRFGSGWVPAPLVDSLTGQVGFDTKTGKVNFTEASQTEAASLKAGRRLMMFGPEGFREAPANHRLVIVMGASPDAFFSAIDDALGAVSVAQQDARHSQLKTDVLAVLSSLRRQRERMADLQDELKAEKD